MGISVKPLSTLDLHFRWHIQPSDIINGIMMISKNSTVNIKAFAILMVLFGHLVGAKKIDVNIAWLDVATFGVSVFLFISGYGLFKSQEAKGLDGFFKSKFKSVYLPFVVATLLVSVSRGFLGNKWPEVLKTVLFVNPSLPVDGTMWYMYYIFMWYVVFYVVFKLVKYDLLRIIIMGVISLTVSQIPFIQKYNVLSFLFAFHAFSFTLGVAAGMCSPVSRKAQFIIGVVCLGAFTYLFSFHFIKYNAINHIMASLLSGPTVVFIISSLEIRSKLLAFIGSISYEIYLFEGAFRWNTFAPDKTSSCIIFFLVTVACAFTLKASISKIRAPSRSPAIS